MTCEGFAFARLGINPADIGQRIIDGLGPALYVLGGNCPAFDFAKMLSNPTSNLPVLFSSLRYRSHKLEQTIYPQLTGVDVDEYWFGLGPWENTLCARSGSNTYSCRAGTWVLGVPGPTSTFKSVPGVMLSSAIKSGSTTLKLLGPPSSTQLLGSALNKITNCQTSGDGLTYFVRSANGWHTYNKITEDWVGIGPDDVSWWLVPSFDGRSLVLTGPASNFHYKIGSADMQTKVADGVGSVYGAVLGATVFVARGSNIYTVGSLNVRSLIYTLPAGAATGIWADDLTVWVATTVGTYMSNDAGWTWTVLNDEFAVGPGLFTKPGSASIWTHSDETFSETIGFPLRLTNGGLLANPSTGWRNGFEDKTMTTASTEILETTTAALSPNGLYLLTNVNGVITVYLNAWNSAKFAEWCNSHDCKAGYARYCQAFGTIDPGCRTDTPGGPDIPGGPDTPNSPSPTPGKGLSTLAIVMIVLGVLALLIGAGFALLRKKSP